jgi:hypothetical protein
MAGAALITTSTATALGQEESPGPDDSMADGSTELVEPSTLGIIDVAAAGAAAQPLKGKELKKAVAKAAPAAASYVIDSTGDDAVGQIIGLSLAARAADEAGDTQAGAAYLAMARLLYRNAWSAAKTDPDSINAELDAAITAAGLQGDPALMLTAIWDRWIDICADPGGSWFIAPENLWSCEEEGGKMVRADFTGIEPDANTSPDEVEQVDAGGLGIHKIVQDASANDKLTGKKFKKTWAKALKKHGPTIASLSVSGPGVTPERQVIEYVLLARTADEAGDAKAAKAFMQLALAAYRAGLPEPNDTGEYNEQIARVARDEYAGSPGLALWPPDDGVDVCFKRKPKDQYMFCIDASSPWECEASGGRLERMSFDEAVCNYCPEHREVYHPEPSCELLDSTGDG